MPDVERILATIRTRESGGNYTAQNPYSSASGAYQFIDRTWRSLGGQTTHARQAGPAEQDRIARAYVTRILAANGGQLDSVPATWYVGHYSPNAPSFEQVPAGGNRLTPRQYVEAWRDTYNSLGAPASSHGGAGAPAFALPENPGGPLGSLRQFVATLFSWALWARVLSIAVGAGLIVAGVRILTNETSPLEAIA